MPWPKRARGASNRRVNIHGNRNEVHRPYHTVQLLENGRPVINYETALFGDSVNDEPSNVQIQIMSREQEMYAREPEDGELTDDSDDKRSEKTMIENRKPNLSWSSRSRKRSRSRENCTGSDGIYKSSSRHKRRRKSRSSSREKRRSRKLKLNKKINQNHAEDSLQYNHCKNDVRVPGSHRAYKTPSPLRGSQEQGPRQSSVYSPTNCGIEDARLPEVYNEGINTEVDDRVEVSHRNRFSDKYTRSEYIRHGNSEQRHIEQEDYFYHDDNSRSPSRGKYSPFTDEPTHAEKQRYYSGEHRKRSPGRQQLSDQAIQRNMRSRSRGISPRRYSSPREDQIRDVSPRAHASSNVQRCDDSWDMGTDRIRHHRQPGTPLKPYDDSNSFNRSYSPENLTDMNHRQHYRDHDANEGNSYCRNTQDQAYSYDERLSNDRVVSDRCRYANEKIPLMFPNQKRSVSCDRDTTFRQRVPDVPIDADQFHANDNKLTPGLSFNSIGIDYSRPLKEQLKSKQLQQDVIAEVMNCLIEKGYRANISDLLVYVRETAEILFETPAEFELFLKNNRDCFQLGKDYDGAYVMVKTDVKVCQQYASAKNVCSDKCFDLHICKFSLFGTCRLPNCKFQHDLFDAHNIEVLKSKHLHKVAPNMIRALLSDIRYRNITTLPVICKFYNNKGNCNKKTNCPHLHLCRHYVNDDCKFRMCMRSHNLNDEQPDYILTKFGITWKMTSERELLQLLRENRQDGSMVRYFPRKSPDKLRTSESDDQCKKMSDTDIEDAHKSKQTNKDQVLKELTIVSEKIRKKKKEKRQQVKTDITIMKSRVLCGTENISDESNSDCEDEDDTDSSSTSNRHTNEYITATGGDLRSTSIAIKSENDVDIRSDVKPSEYILAGTRNNCRYGTDQTQSVVIQEPKLDGCLAGTAITLLQSQSIIKQEVIDENDNMSQLQESTTFNMAPFEQENANDKKLIHDVEDPESDTRLQKCTGNEDSAEPFAKNNDTDRNETVGKLADATNMSKEEMLALHRIENIVAIEQTEVTNDGIKQGLIGQELLENTLNVVNETTAIENLPVSSFDKKEESIELCATCCHKTEDDSVSTFPKDLSEHSDHTTRSQVSSSVQNDTTKSMEHSEVNQNDHHLSDNVPDEKEDGKLTDCNVDMTKDKRPMTVAQDFKTVPRKLEYFDGKTNSMITFDTNDLALYLSDGTSNVKVADDNLNAAIQQSFDNFLKVIRKILYDPSAHDPTEGVTQ